jgi:probable phosphoglycerate mutase
MIRLALLRHGHTRWNREGRIQGRTDIPLDPEAEAHLSTRCLPMDWAHADLTASPLERAWRTAELVAGRPARREAVLMEMNWGLWEGQHGRVLRENPDTGFRDIEDWSWTFCPPEGESPADLRARLVPWAEALSRDTLAVCHIGVMRVLLAHGTGWDFRGPAPFRVKRDRLYVLRISPADWRVEDTQDRLPERPA